MKISILTPLIISELGNRSNQEDAVYPIQGKSSVSDRLFILCDGMGGHDDGEVASQLVCKTLSTYIIKHLKEGVLTDTILNDAIDETFDKINRYESDSLKKMGTTLTLLCLHQGGATMAHIGDSRIYHIRPSEHRILYKSRDHSLAYDLYLAGEISLDEVDNYKKNVITRAIMPGLNRRPKTDIVHTTDLQKDDYFLLCSDGLLEQMSDDELLAILCSNDSNDKKRNILIDKTAGNKDNHSAIVVQLSDIVKDSHQDSYLHDEHINKSNAILLEQGQNKKDIQPQLCEKKSKIFKSVLDMFKKLFLFIFFLSLPLSLMAQAAGGEVIRRSKTINTTDKIVVEKKQPILKVTCPTNGAIIYINKKKMGSVPWSGELSPGNYTVEACLKDYYSSQKTVKLKNNDNKTISIDALKPMAGTLSVFYYPNNAEVWIDGIKYNISSGSTVSLPVGRHGVRICSNGYIQDTQAVVIEGEKNATLKFTLKSKSSQNISLPPNTVSKKAEPIRRDIFFEKNSATIRKSEESKLKDIAVYLNSNPNSKLHVTGYNVNDENTVVGNILSQLRAEKVRSMLVKNYNIPFNRITIFWHKSDIQPFAERDLNRVVICIAE